MPFCSCFYLLLKYLPPVPNQEYFDCREEAEDEVRPVELLVHHGRGEEVAEHDDEDDAGDQVDQDLEAEQVVHLQGQGVQVCVDPAENVQL